MYKDLTQLRKELDCAEVFLRNRANCAPAPLNEYDKEALVDISNLISTVADKIEQGRMVELPCGVGETVYHITTCEGFTRELDGSLYDAFGGLGDATGFYCPCELRDNCPFDNEENLDCDVLTNKQAIFKDTVVGFSIQEHETCVFLEYSGCVNASAFGYTVFLTAKEADAKLKEIENEG